MESTGNHRQAEMPWMALVKEPSITPPHIVSRLTDIGAMRLAVQESGHDDYEIADAIAISHGYMSKVLKGTAGLYGRRLVAFMRRTNSLAPLQWLANQMGCDVVMRDAQAARIAELQAELNQLRRGVA